MLARRDEPKRLAPGGQEYSNRRLYDTAESRMSRLRELAESIRPGADARVVDADRRRPHAGHAGADHHRGAAGAQFLSVPILTQLIRMNDDALAEFFGRWVSAAPSSTSQARQGVAAIAPTTPRGPCPSPPATSSCGCSR